MKNEKNLSQIRKATHSGILEIGDSKIPCAVLEDGTRILSETGITESFGAVSGSAKAVKKKLLLNGGALLPLFVASERLMPFISKELREGLLIPIIYKKGESVLQGYPAELFPQICDVWLKARASDALMESQLSRAHKAEILMRGLAHVGIVALVDSATGFEKDRTKGALQEILDSFITKELRPWIKSFPDDYYKNIFRLRGLEISDKKKNYPQYFGHITNDIVYDRLAPCLKEELQRLSKKGKYKDHFHRRLTENIGHPKLKEYLSSLITIMKLSSDYEDFKNKLDIIHPAFNETLSLDFESANELPKIRT
jgi:hypothetical protein